jgi:hypothetical protein
LRCGFKFRIRRIGSWEVQPETLQL